MKINEAQSALPVFSPLLEQSCRFPFGKVSLVAILSIFGLCHAPAQAVFLDGSTAGNTARVNTPYGDSIYMFRPGVNVNPAFKVEDMQANWSRDNISGFSSSADMEPMVVGDIPTLLYEGKHYLAPAFDFNETGGTPDFDVINLFLLAGNSPASTLDAGTLIDPDLSGYSWAGNPSNQQVNKWDNNLRELAVNSSAAAMGLDLVYEQNVSPRIFTSGDTRPYDSDPERVYATGLATLGSNETDVMILVPASVLSGRALTDVVYMGIQTGTLNDGGSDRFGIVDPSTLITGGYLDSNGYTFQPYSQIPEPQTSVLLLGMVGLGLVIRKRK
jgi:hypothetical protein